MKRNENDIDRTTSRKRNSVIRRNVDPQDKIPSSSSDPQRKACHTETVKMTQDLSGSFEWAFAREGGETLLPKDSVCERGALAVMASKVSNG